MGSEKKYYWLKLQRDFFKRHDVRIIEEMENGKDYLLFYLKLLVEVGNTGGTLRLNEKTYFDTKMLSIITNTDCETVEKSIEVLSRFGLVQRNEDGALIVNKVRDARDRSTTAYKEWRKAVYERDNYTCRMCGKSGVRLNAHHIKSWKRFPAFRYDINNGVTLCEKCHKAYHRIVGRA